MSHNLSCRLLTSLLIASNAPTLLAQDTDTDTETTAPANPERKSRMLEEVIVTAQKREENMQDVPISITAFSESAIDALGINDPQDLQRVTPGLTYNTAVGFSIIYLRGIGSDAFLMADPSVALYIDGVYYPFAQGLAQDFGAVERIEVLKGPQGTLFGRNAVGGAINIVSKNADPTELHASVEVGYGRYDNLRVKGYINLPITDTTALNVSAFKNSAEQYYKGTTEGERFADQESQGVRLKGIWEATENLTINLAAVQYESTGPGTLITPNSDPSPVAGATITPERGYNAEFDAPVFQNFESEVLYGDIYYALDAFDIKLIASDQKIDTHYGYDFDSSGETLLNFSSATQFSYAKSAEIQFLSNEESYFSDWLSWITGVYYFESRQGFDPVEFEIAGLALDLPDILPGIPTGEISLRALIDTESTAAFFQATADITDWFSLTLGGRYQHEERTIVKSSSELKTTSEGQILGDFGDGRSVITESFKPKISLDFRPFADLDFLTYFSYQEAIKSATYNVVVIVDEPELVEPEDLTAYEIGFKATFFDGMLRLNAAAFQYELENQQVQYVSLTSGGAISFENAGASEVEGFDFDTTLQLFPQYIDALILTLSGAYLEGEFIEYTNARGFDENSGLGVSDLDYTGNTIPRTPQKTVSLGLSKTFFLENSFIEVSSDAYYNSGFFFSPQNTDASYQDEYHVVNARVSYVYEPYGLNLSLWAKNIESEKFADGQFAQDFGTATHLSKPNSYGIKLRWDY